MGMCVTKCATLRKMLEVVRYRRNDGSLAGSVMHRYARRGKDVRCTSCDFAIQIEFLKKKGFRLDKCFCCGNTYRTGGQSRRSPDHPRYHKRDREKGLVKVKRY